MTNFKSAKEMAQALFFDGKKITNSCWGQNEYMLWSDKSNQIINHNGNTAVVLFGCYDEYSIYEEPKQPEYLYEVAEKLESRKQFMLHSILRKENDISPIWFKTGRKFIENDKGELVEVSK
jgi:hypothetical protein